MKFKKRARGLIEFLRERALGLVLHAGVFVLVAAAIVSLLNYVPRTQVFWAVFKGHFAHDQKYQLQGLFLPKQELDQSVLVLGDTQFHNDMADTIPADTSVVKIVNNSYDPDDVGITFNGIKDGYKFTKTKPCAALVLVTPLFLTRGKAEGPSQSYRSIRYVHKDYSLETRLGNAFTIARNIADVRNTMPNKNADSKRPNRMVGQTRVSDPTLENWGIAFAGVEAFERPVLAILDTEGTDWSKEGNLIDATHRQLDVFSAEHANFSWISLEKLNETTFPTCETK